MKPKYEKPKFQELNKVLANGASGNCTPGVSASPYNCNPGGTAGTNNCNSGGTAAKNCNGGGAPHHP